MEVAIIQLIAYVMLTLASITVAATSMLVGWWQIFGWKPTQFVTGVAVNSVGGTTHTFKATVTMEVWNRRKYPIAISGGSSVDFGQTEVADSADQGPWHQRRNTMCYYGDKLVIEPLSHREIVVNAILRVKDRKDIADHWDVLLKYFDPASNKTLELTATAYYLEPERDITRG